MDTRDGVILVGLGQELVEELTGLAPLARERAPVCAVFTR